MGVDERGVQDLINEAWTLIDQAKARLQDSNVSENDKIRWAGVLANAIGSLNKLLWKAGMGKVDEEDLAQILSKIPEKYAKMVRGKLGIVDKPDFSAIGQGDLVQIEWLDASLSRNVVKVTNRIIATYKKTVGRFVGIFKDARYGAQHVIIQHETNDTGISDISSIPFAIIVKVKRLAPKDAMKKFKRGTDAQWTQNLRGGGVKIVTRRARK